MNEDLSDQIESRMKHKAPQEWEKHPDAPLGEVIAEKTRQRKIMREHGGRDALIIRSVPKPKE